jgi:hypothetical protein
MAQLGNRILFYEIAREEWSEEDLMEFAQTYGAVDAVKECQKAVNDLVENHFKKHPVNSIDPQSIDIPEGLMLELVRYGKLIAHGRVEVRVDEWGSVPEAEEPEGPQRVILLLKSIVRGLALAEGRTTVMSDDLVPIRHVAFSSMPRKRRELLRALLVAGGSLASSETDKALGVSRSTASNRMKELAATKIVDFSPADQQTSTPEKILLAIDWRWLLDETPYKQNGGVCGDDRSALPTTPL